MKKKIGIVFMLTALIANIALLSACGSLGNAANDESDFIGTYNSKWVESVTSSYISFTLKVSSNKTFVLKRFDGDDSTEKWTSIGTWAGNTSEDDFGIICFVTDSDRASDYEYYGYFTLTLLDDGSVVGSSGVVSCFDTGAGATVVFSKE